jgi:hypothetical protein
VRTRWIVLLVLAGACSPPPSATPATATPPDLGALAVRVAQEGLFAKQVEAIARQTQRPPTQVAATFVQQQILAELAQKAGLALPATPRIDQAMVQRWIDLQITPQLQRDKIPEDFLRSIYDRARGRYQHPRQVELEVLAIYTGIRMKPDPKAQRRQAAHELEAYLAKAPTDEDFAALAGRPEWVRRHVTYVRVFQGPDAPLPPAVGQATLKFNRRGQTTRLIADDDGFFIAKYVGERPALHIPFAQAKAQIIEENFVPWRRLRFAELTTALLKQHAIEFVAAP